MAKKQFTKGELLGQWDLQANLSGGGNSYVWTAINSKGEERIIKILKKEHNTAIARFWD